MGPCRPGLGLDVWTVAVIFTFASIPPPPPILQVLPCVPPTTTQEYTARSHERCRGERSSAGGSPTSLVLCRRASPLFYSTSSLPAATWTAASGSQWSRQPRTAASGRQEEVQGEGNLEGGTRVTRMMVNACRPSCLFPTRVLTAFPFFLKAPNKIETPTCARAC